MVDSVGRIAILRYCQSQPDKMKSCCLGSREIPGHSLSALRHDPGAVGDRLTSTDSKAHQQRSVAAAEVAYVVDQSSIATPHTACATYAVG
jgi:hypothetical protein